MMAPQDVLQASTTNQRTLFPRTGIVKVEPGTRVTRDDRRRATHNEGQLFIVYLFLAVSFILHLSLCDK